MMKILSACVEKAVDIHQLTDVCGTMSQLEVLFGSGDVNFTGGR